MSSARLSRAIKVIRTGSECFDDGVMLDSVRDASDSSRLALINRQLGKFSIVSKFSHNGRTYLPADLDAALVRRLRLPDNAEPYGSVSKLLTQICTMVAKYCCVSEEAAFLLSCFTLATFVSDCFTSSPCLVIFGSSEEAETLLRVLGWLCYHPLLLSDTRQSQLPQDVIFTRLIFPIGSKRQVHNLLKNSRLSGFTNSGYGGLRRILGASAIYFEGDESCSRSTDGCLQVTLSPGGRPVTLADEVNENLFVQHLQNKLLCYRLDNFAAVRDSHFDVPQFAGATRGLARNLGSCLINAPEAQARLVLLLQGQDNESRIARSEEPGAIVLEALLLICHERKRTAYVGEIATATNKILLGRQQIDAIDGAGSLSAREVGGKLTSLGLHTTRLDAAGRGLILDLPTQKRIHELARLRETFTAQQGMPGCPCCQGFFKT